MKSQGKLLAQTLARTAGDTDNTSYQSGNPQTETSVGASPKAGKPELYLMHCYRLSVDSPRLNNSRRASHKRPSHFWEFYCQKIYQILTVSIEEKSPHAFSEPFWNMPRHFIVLNKVSPQEKQFYQSLPDLRKENAQLQLPLDMLSPLSGEGTRNSQSRNWGSPKDWDLIIEL